MQLKILDTGYISGVDVSIQTQAVVANRAGFDGTTGVSALALDIESLSISADVRVENKPIINSLTEVSTSLVSTMNRIIRVSGVLSKEVVTSGYSVNNIVQFMRLERTKGLKLFYPTVVTDTYKSVVEALGAENTGGEFSDAAPTDTMGKVSTTTPYLVGRVKDISLTELTAQTHL